VVLTKVDKLSQGDRTRCTSRCREVLGLAEDELIVQTSSRKGTGIVMLWKEIEARIDAAKQEGPTPTAAEHRG